MKFNTKYDIGDIVKFIRKQKTVGGDKIEHSPEVGIIEKILYNGESMKYLLKSSYQDWIAEDEILHKLKIKGEEKSLQDFTEIIDPTIKPGEVITSRKVSLFDAARRVVDYLNKTGG